MGIFRILALLPAFASASALSASLGVFAPNNQQAFMTMVEVLQEDDVKAFLSGKDSLSSDLVNGPYTASAIIAMYEKNELSANKKLKGKPVRVKSVASEIGENFARQAYIKADGKNQFQSINLLVDGNDDRILNLSKGSKIDMVCGNVRYVMHTPILGDCQFSSDFASKPIFPDDVVVDGKFEPTNLSQVAMVFTYKANEKGMEKACLSGKKECLSKVSEFAKSKSMEPSFKNLMTDHESEARSLFDKLSNNKK